MPQKRTPKSDTGLVPWTAYALLFALLLYDTKIGALIGLGFLIGYFWGYLRVFWQIQKVFGEQASSWLFNIFKGKG